MKLYVFRLWRSGWWKSGNPNRYLLWNFGRIGETSTWVFTCGPIHICVSRD